MHFEKFFNDFQQHPPFGWAVLLFFVLPPMMGGSAYLRSKGRGFVNAYKHNGLIFESLLLPIFAILGIPLIVFCAFCLLHIFRSKLSFEPLFAYTVLLMTPMKIWNILSGWNRINRIFYLIYQNVWFVMCIYAFTLFGALVEHHYKLNFWQALLVAFPVMLLALAENSLDFALGASTVRSRLLWKREVGNSVILYHHKECKTDFVEALKICDDILQKETELMKVKPLDFKLEIFMCSEKAMLNLFPKVKPLAVGGYSLGDSIILVDKYGMRMLELHTRWRMCLFISESRNL